MENQHDDSRLRVQYARWLSAVSAYRLQTLHTNPSSSPGFSKLCPTHLKLSLSSSGINFVTIQSSFEHVLRRLTLSACVFYAAHCFHTRQHTCHSQLKLQNPPCQLLGDLKGVQACGNNCHIFQHLLPHWLHRNVFDTIPHSCNETVSNNRYPHHRNSHPQCEAIRYVCSARSVKMLQQQVTEYVAFLSICDGIFMLDR